MQSSNTSSSRTGLVRTVILPIVVLVVIGVGATRWLSAGRVPGFTINQCQRDSYKKEKLLPDVLLIGSSRMGFAIDDVVVSETLSEINQSAEKLMIIGSVEIHQDLALREYVKNRGIPKVLGIEVSIDKKDGFEKPAWTAFKTTEWLRAVPAPSTYVEILKDSIDARTISVADIAIRSRVANPIAVTLSRLQLGFEQAIRNPRGVLEPQKTCGRNYFKMFRNGWAEPMTSDHSLPSERKLKLIRDSATRVPDAQIDSPRAVGEFEILNDIVRFAYSSGVEQVILMYFPDFEEDLSVMPAKQIIERVPNAPLFDVRNVFAEGDTRTKNQYLDWRHMNSQGAWEVSRALGQFIIEMEGAEK